MNAAWLERTTDTVELLLAQLAFGSSLVLAVTGLAAMATCRSSAAIRHRIWGIGLTSLLFLPFVYPWLASHGPRWIQLPAREAAILEITPRVANTTLPELDPHPLPIDIPAIENDFPFEEFVEAPAIEEILPTIDSDPQASEPRTEATIVASPPTARQMPVSEPTPAVTAPPAKATENHNPFQWVAFGWLAGSAIALMRFAFMLLATRLAVRRAVPVTDSHLREIVFALSKRLGISRPVSIVCSPRNDIPVTVGAFRSMIVLPTGFGTWTAEISQTVLAHEMVHIARRDVQWQMIARLACCVYWCHPLVWLAAWRLRVEREYACDDAVLTLGNNPGQYASQLVDVAEMVSGKNRAFGTAVAMARPGHVERRVRAILHPNKSRRPVTSRVGSIVAVAATFVLLTAGLLGPTVGIRDQADAAPLTSELPENNDLDASAALQKSTSHSTAGVITQSSNTDEDSASELVTVSGTVVNTEGSQVAGVSIEFGFRGKQGTTSTDSSGRFEFQLPIGNKFDYLLARSDNDRFMASYHESPWPVPMDFIKHQNPSIKLILKPSRRITAAVADESSKPIEGANVGVLTPFQTASMVTDADGRAAMLIPRDMPVYHVYSWKRGQGLDYRSFFDRGKVSTGQPQDDVDWSRPVELTLSGVHPVIIHVRDADTAHPISGASVSPWIVHKPDNDRLNLAYIGNDVRVLSNSNGAAVFDWLPKWIEQSESTFSVKAEGYDRSRKVIENLQGHDFTITLQKLVPIRGQVRQPNGQPAAGIIVKAGGIGSKRKRVNYRTTTDADGRYGILAHPGLFYLIAVDDNKWASTSYDGLHIRRNEPIDNLDFQLQPATRVYGRVTFGPDKRPAVKQPVVLFQQGQILKDAPGAYETTSANVKTPLRPTISRGGETDALGVLTDDEGWFQFFVGPGQYLARVAVPSTEMKSEFEIIDNRSQQIGFHLARDMTKRVRGIVVTGEPPQPVPYASIYGRSRHLDKTNWFHESASDANGQFDFEPKPFRKIMLARSKDEELAGIIDVDSNVPEIKIFVEPTGTANGQLLQSGTNDPVSGREIRYGVRASFDVEDNDTLTEVLFTDFVKTDNDGRFTLTGLIVGQQYDISVQSHQPVRDNFGKAIFYRYHSIHEFVPTTSELIDLGTFDVVTVGRNVSSQGNPVATTQSSRTSTSSNIP